MINDVDESLRALVRRDVLNGANVDVSFESPSKDWSARRSAPTLNLYLYDIREDLSRRETQFEEVLDERGRVVERRPPPRMFKLSYLVTAWTQRPEDEHRLLSAMLSCFLPLDALPPEILRGEVADEPRPLRLTIGLPLPADRNISDVWSALGGELKASLDLVVTAPFDTRRRRPSGPPVLEERLVMGQLEEEPAGPTLPGVPPPPPTYRRVAEERPTATGDPDTRVVTTRAGGSAPRLPPETAPRRMPAPNGS